MPDSRPIKDYVISYLNLRKSLGTLGILFPVTLIAGNSLLYNGQILSTISSYYHSPLRDLFVGVLCAMATFMFVYRGPEKRDDIVGSIAGVLLLGVAFLPTDTGHPFQDVNPWIGHVHRIMALLFFLAMAYFCLKLFTKTNPDTPMTPKKQARNRIYRICGYLILLCIVGILVYKLTPLADIAALATLKPVLWLEAAAMMAFGLSWLVKGEALLADQS